MKTIPSLIRSLVCPALIALLTTSAQATSQDYLARAKQAKVGLFVHYVFGQTKGQTALYTPMNIEGRKPKDLNELADAFDPKKFADFAEAMGAEYVIFTAFHAGMNTLYPSQVMGEILPEKVSKRDVIRELQDAMDAKGIPLMLYWHPTDSHDLSKKELDQITAKYPDFGDFVLKLMQETTARYGSRIAGYWFDAPNGKFSQTSVPHFKAMILKDTPNAVIWANFNRRDLCNVTTKESPRPSKDPNTDTWETKTTQMCMLSSVGWWAKPKGKIVINARGMFRYTVRLAGTKGQTNGGAAWSDGPYGDNTWGSGVAENLAEMGKMLKARREAIYGTNPSTSYVTEPNTVQTGTWGVATDAADGKTVYLHVLNPPKDSLLEIAKAADGRVFSKASLLDGRDVSLKATDKGYTLTLPSGAQWDAVDTVIRLQVQP